MENKGFVLGCPGQKVKKIRILPNASVSFSGHSCSKSYHLSEAMETFTEAALRDMLCPQKRRFCRAQDWSNWIEDLVLNWSFATVGFLVFLAAALVKPTGDRVCPRSLRVHISRALSHQQNHRESLRAGCQQRFPNRQLPNHIVAEPVLCSSKTLLASSLHRAQASLCILHTLALENPGPE